MSRMRGRKNHLFVGRWMSLGRQCLVSACVEVTPPRLTRDWGFRRERCCVVPVSGVLLSPRDWLVVHVILLRRQGSANYWISRD